MHRKSLEAADQLKDDNTTASNQSEKEDGDDNDDDDDADEEEDADDADEDSNSADTPSKAEQLHASEKSAATVAELHLKEEQEKRDEKMEEHAVEPYQNGSPRPPYVGESPEEAHLRIRQEIQTQMEQHHAAVMQLAVSSRTDPEEFRNNSIACLRAKAQEHSAKIFSLSADALMLVNNNAAAAAAFLHRSSLGGGVPPHYDANANNLPNIHNYYPSAGHQQEMTNTDIVTSSDSSPIF